MAPPSCTSMTQETAYPTFRLRLPSSLDSLKPEVFEAAIKSDHALPELDEGLERAIIESLVAELNSKFHVGLDANFTTSRELGATDTEEELSGDNYIVVGSSHACRLVEALKNIGESVTSLANPRWRLTEENAKTLAVRLKSAVAANPTATVIFWIFDSCIYFSSTAPGERSLPRRGKDGHFHVQGELTMADWPTFKLIFASSIPLLRAAGKSKKIILSPLPRYINGRCCPDESHLSNFGTREYVKSMGNCLAEMDDWLKDLAYSKRILHFTVICTATMADLDSPKSKKKELAKWWGTDPINMLPAGYSKVAEKLSDRIEKDQQEDQEIRLD